MIRFGSMSFVLMLGAIQGGVVAAGLLRKNVNRRPNRLLAALVLVLALKLVPYIIGYAGFYNAYPWLDLAPFDMGLATGPLLYLYICSITLPDAAPRWKLHLVPPIAQFAIYCVLFAQPLKFKQWFETHIGTAFNTCETVLVVLSLSTYTYLTWRRYLQYEVWLKNQFGDPDAHRLRYLRTVLVPLSATLLAFVGAKVWGLCFRELNYFQMFPFYVMLTLTVYAFGFTAFQFAEIHFPVVLDPLPTKEIDWRAAADEYGRELAELSFWRDPQLSISLAAKALNTSETRLSKAINQGYEITFAEWINRHRITEVARRLSDPAEDLSIQELALECGFNSKASFNRWFRIVIGSTPTQYRDSARIGAANNADIPLPGNQESAS